MELTGKICNIQPFSIHDGPGIRTVVFMKGCNLRCYWCHNPESQERGMTIAFHPHKCIGCGACAEVCPAAVDGKPAFFTDRCLKCGKCAENCFSEAIAAIGEDVTVSGLVKKLEKDKSIFASSGGGVTFSGGEPLLQPDFVAAVMKECQRMGIHTAVETAICVPWENVEKILPYCDFFLCDLKSADSQKHREATGAGNERILENLSRLAKTGKALEIRTPVIPGFNDTEEDIAKIGALVRSFGPGIPHTLLPFHSMCTSKYESQGRRFAAADLEEPSDTKMKQLNEAKQVNE